MSTLGWLASVASSVFILATQVQAMIEVTNASFGFPNWQYTLIMLAFLVITIFFNTWGAKVLPMLETISLFGHLAGFFVVMIPLVVLCQKNSAHAVFLEVVNNGGWSHTGTACLVSQVTVMFCNLGKLIDIFPTLIVAVAHRMCSGSDSVVHICKSPATRTAPKNLLIVSVAEEVEDAGLVVPRCMWWRSERFSLPKLKLMKG
jgi:choline transport protein